MGRSSLERGATLFEALAVMAIVTTALVAGAAVTFAAHPNERTQSDAQLLGMLDRAHQIATTNGATISIAPSGRGSRIQILDGFGSGNVTETLDTVVPVALHYTGGTARTAQLLIRRDGSWYPAVGGTQQACDGTEAIGLVAHGETTPVLGESYALSCADVHAVVSQ